MGSASGYPTFLHAKSHDLPAPPKIHSGVVVGLTLGLKEGDTDGLVLGLPLGDTLGDADGLALGEADGDNEGDAVGLTDGADVGSTVGARPVHGQNLAHALCAKPPHFAACVAARVLT